MGERKLGGAGEIVAVQGGHIVRSTGRKDRHSKVCTAKGPRDRRVRLAAHTAIQFYDVQDRLGYDRPSKAVDWLIKKAKAAIDELEKLPAWNPIAVPTGSFDPEIDVEGRQQQRRGIEHGAEDDLGISDVSGEGKLNLHGGEDEHRRSSVASNSRALNSSGLPPSSLESDAIKFVFPFDGSIEESSSPFHFPRFSNPDFESRTGRHTRDLKLPLQFQNPILLPNHYTQQQQQPQLQRQVLLSGIPLGVDGTTTASAAFAFALPDHHHQAAELRFQNLPSWNSGGDSIGYSFNSPPAHQLSGIEQSFSQRGPLQSSTTPSIRAWIDPISMAADHQPHHQGFLPTHPPSLSGFQIPARVQGDEHQHDGFLNKPSSASSTSRR